MKELAIGIDLGTTFSAVGVYRNGQVEMIPNRMGNRTTPSWVAFTDEEILIGEAAKNQAAANPKNTLYDIKRLIGRRFSDAEVQKDVKLWPFQVKGDAQDKPLIAVTRNGKEETYHPEQISAMVLGYMKQIAEEYLGQSVKKAVITVPAYFGDAQRASTRDAAIIAGLEPIRILSEPTSACMCYGLGTAESTDGKEKKVLVFDFGGGTHDVSLLNVDGTLIECVAVAGDGHLGGSDLDQALLEHFINEFKRKNKGLDPSGSARAVNRLRAACERVKIQLSSSTTANLDIDSFFEGVDFHASITRARYEELASPIFQRAMAPVDKVLLDGKVSKNQIDEIILVGGSTRGPKVQQLLSDYFNGKQLNKSVHPDEAVAYGAAVQAAVLTGNGDEKTSELLLLDVTPLTLSIETAGEVATPVIPRNSTIPTKKSIVASTFSDNQPAVTIRVFEGERAMTRDCTLLGAFDLEGIPPAPRGVPQIEITFDLDANGILKVTAIEKGTGKSKDLTIKNDKGRLSKEEIERMVADAEKHKAEDEARRAKIEARNDLENMAYSLRNSLREHKDPSFWKEAEPHVQNVIEWLDATPSATVDDYKAKKEELERATAPLMQRFYAGESGGSSSAAAGVPPSGDYTPGETPIHNTGKGPLVEELD